MIFAKFFNTFSRAVLRGILPAFALMLAASSYAVPSMDMSKVLKSGKELPPPTPGRCLKEGASAPDFTLPEAKGKSFNLYKALEKKNVVLVFYRGGWCPYCNFQLRAYNRELKPAEAKNYQMVAISPDKMDASINITPRSEFGFTVLSDPKLAAITPYKLGFKVPDKMVAKLKTKGVDLNAQSGETHQTLAVPAVVIISKDRKIKWCYASENYKVRPAVAELKARLAKLN